MGARYDVDQRLYVPVKVVAATTDETGTVYQVKMVSKEQVITQYFEEDELIETMPSA